MAPKAQFGPLIGMVHVQALPGTPRGRLDIDSIAERASAEAKVLVDAGFHSLMIENMHDTPYVAGVQGPEIVAAMTRVGLAVRAAAPLTPLGVQVLACGNREALAVALAIGAAFVRVENFVFAHVADEGLMARAEAGELLRYRRAIGAEHIKVFADVKKKHASHAITADVGIAVAAEAAEFFGADGIVVSGEATGRPVDMDELAQVRAATGLPIFAGSGATPLNAAELLGFADGLIVGSSIKRGGVWSGSIDPARCRELVRAVTGATRPRPPNGRKSHAKKRS